MKGSITRETKEKVIKKKGRNMHKKGLSNKSEG